MNAKVWVGFAALLVAASGVMGYTSFPQRPTPVPVPVSSFLSEQQVITIIQKQQLQQSKVVQDIRVIHMDANGNEGFAFATFDMNGKKKYASLIISQTGYGMTSFTLGTDKVVPIQFVTQRTDGFEYVTGGIFLNPNVKSAVVIWSNGTAVTVPVRDGLFWYEHKVQISSRVYVKDVIGITTSGAMVQNRVNVRQ